MILALANGYHVLTKLSNLEVNHDLFVHLTWTALWLFVILISAEVINSVSKRISNIANKQLTE
jgi:hypothetical protein